MNRTGTEPENTDSWTKTERKSNSSETEWFKRILYYEKTFFQKVKNQRYIVYQEV